jgi:hypothetical protein
MRNIASEGAGDAGACAILPRGARRDNAQLE